MPIVTGDIDFHLSGGLSNTDVNLSLGGVRSTTQLTDNTLNNLWDDVSGAESTPGDTEYRCIYVENAHGSLTLQGARIWISTNTTTPSNAIAIGLHDVKDGTAQTIADESTAPNESDTVTPITFSQPTSFAGGLSLGELAAGEHYAIWIRRIIPAAQSAQSNVTYTLSVQGDTAA